MASIENATPGESRIATALVKMLLENGYCVSVYDGEEYTVRKSVDATAILQALATTGIDNLIVRVAATGERAGTIALVWGNSPDGTELPSDWGWAETLVGNEFNAMLDAWHDKICC